MPSTQLALKNLHTTTFLIQTKLKKKPILQPISHIERSKADSVSKFNKVSAKVSQVLNKKNQEKADTLELKLRVFEGIEKGIKNLFIHPFQDTFYQSVTITLFGRKARESKEPVGGLTHKHVGVVRQR